MTTTAATTPYARLLEKLRDAATLGSVDSALSWDQEAIMPPKAASMRADQLAMLSGMTHEMKTSAELGELIGEAEADLTSNTDPLAPANLREIRHDYDKATKLPADLVRDMARTASLGMDAWKEARKNKDFSRFQPWLEKTVELSRRKAACYGVPAGGQTYDVLLDDFEPGMTAAATTELFAPLRAFTVEFLQTLRDKTSGFTNTPDPSPLTVETDINDQRAFSRFILEQMGFDFEGGRLDEAAHPFCSGFGPGDTRLTNRYRPDGWLDSLSSGMHEGGHGLYEQGLLKSEHFGAPVAQAVSLGVHESQSRLWENQVGRSLGFWRWALPHARAIYKNSGGVMDALTPEAVYRATNLMQPSFIRVESDELTYNLHIMMRFDFERAMIDGDLAIKDVPAEWNKRVKADWGLDVPDDAQGCLQDVHWSMGTLGYFPTYTFGNIFSAMLWETIGEALPERDQQIARGEFGPLLAWLRTNVHEPGRTKPAKDLIEGLCGREVSTEPLQNYLRAKAGDVFGV